MSYLVRRMTLFTVFVVLLVALMPAFAQTEVPIDPDISHITENLQTRPLPTALPELPQEVVSVDGVFRFHIPADWVGFTEYGIFTSSSESVAQRFSNITALYEADEVGLQIILKDELTFYGIDPIQEDALALFAVVYAQFENEGDPILYESLADADADPDASPVYPLYFSFLTADFVPAGAYMMVAQVGEAPDDVVVILGVAGDFEAAEPTIIAIIHSMSYLVAETE